MVLGSIWESVTLICMDYAECVPLTTSYHLYFLSKVRSYIKRQWRDFTVKNIQILFLFFNKKNCVFIIFIFFFWWSIEYPQQNINQSQTGTGDKKFFSVELYVQYFSLTKKFMKLTAWTFQQICLFLFHHLFPSFSEYFRYLPRKRLPWNSFSLKFTTYYKFLNDKWTVAFLKNKNKKVLFEREISPHHRRKVLKFWFRARKMAASW